MKTLIWLCLMVLVDALNPVYFDESKYIFIIFLFVCIIADALSLIIKGK